MKSLLLPLLFTLSIQISFGQIDTTDFPEFNKTRVSVMTGLMLSKPATNYGRKVPDDFHQGWSVKLCFEKDEKIGILFGAGVVSSEYNQLTSRKIEKNTDSVINFLLGFFGGHISALDYRLDENYTTIIEKNVLLQVGIHKPIKLNDYSTISAYVMGGILSTFETATTTHHASSYSSHPEGFENARIENESLLNKASMELGLKGDFSRYVVSMGYSSVPKSFVLGMGYRF